MVISFDLLLGGAILGIHHASASAAARPKPQTSKGVDRLPEGKGKAIIVKKCQSCHALESIVASHRSKDEWNDVLGLMSAAGDALTPDETPIVLDYLAANFGPASSKPPDSAVSAQTSQTSTANLIGDPERAQFSEVPDSLGLPKGLEMSVVSGDPSKAGLFSVLFRIPAGQMIPPYRFSKDENIVCLRGALQVGEGATFDANTSQTLYPGAVMHAPAQKQHFVRATEATIILVFGDGPLFTSKISTSAED
jgi:quercetin dioxygenase-like cupin family protein